MGAARGVRERRARLAAAAQVPCEQARARGLWPERAAVGSRRQAGASASSGGSAQRKHTATPKWARTGGAAHWDERRGSALVRALAGLALGGWWSRTGFGEGKWLACVRVELRRRQTSRCGRVGLGESASDGSTQSFFPRGKQRRRAGARAWGDQVVVYAGHGGGGTVVGRRAQGAGPAAGGARNSGAGVHGWR
jgi:hypothetical protein